MIELMVVIAIISILSTLGLTYLSSARGKARDARRVEDMRQLDYALTIFLSDHGHFPSNSKEGISLTGEMIGDDDGPIEQALKPYFKSGMPRDPRHDGSTYFYSYDPVHCIVHDSGASCDCPPSAGNGVVVAFNKAESGTITLRKETFGGSDMNQCNADFNLIYTPAAY